LTWSIVVPAADWLSVSLTSTQTAAGDATPVDVTLDASTLSAGTYTATLTIDSDDPFVSQRTIPVTLTVGSACVPVAGASFTFAPAAPQVGQTVNFSASVTAGDMPISYAWDFGDTNTGTGQYTTHTYNDVLTYTVMLTATNGCPSTDTDQTQISVVSAGSKVYLPLVLKQ
jgi:PKD repeat protein